MAILPSIVEADDWNLGLDGIATGNNYEFYRQNPDFLANIDFGDTSDVMPDLEDVFGLYSKESQGAGAGTATNGVDGTGALMRVSASSCDRGSTSDESKNSRDGKRKPRMVWTPELHKRFEEVVEIWGGPKAVPSKILKEMGDESLTRDQIASHLQKYRLHQKPESSSRKDEASSHYLPTREEGASSHYLLTPEDEASSRNQRRRLDNASNPPLSSTTDAAALFPWAEAAVAREAAPFRLLSEPPPQHYYSHLFPSMYFHS